MNNNSLSLKKTIKKIFSILIYIILIALAILVVRLLINQSKGKPTFVFGYTVMRITSPSMVNKDNPDDGINPGEYILVKQVNANDIKVGDVISFYSTDPNIFGKINTHRVFDIDTSNGFTFTTKGDNNNIEDSYPVTQSQLIGKKVFKFITISKLMNIFMRYFAFILAVLIAITGYCSGILKKVVEKQKKDEMEKRIKEEVERLKLYGLDQDDNK